MKILCLLALCFFWAFTATATESTPEELLAKEKISRAILKFEHTQRDLWSYTISRYEDEEGDISSSIEQYSPQGNKQWLLKQINGQQPTKKQVEQFVKKKKKQNTSGQQESNVQLSLRKLIDQESLSLVSIDDKQIIMTFDVHFKKLGKDSIGKLQGRLTYQKEQQFIEKISIWNIAEFSPMFTANITDLTVNFTFLQIDGAVLTKKNEMKLKGSFAYFTEINETSLDTFSDYLYHGR